MTLSNVLIVGAGYTGLEIARQATEAGLNVVATTSNAERRQALQKMGAHVFEWQANADASALAAHLDAHTALIYSVPPLPKTYAPGDEDTSAEHLIPLLATLEVAKAQGCPRFVYLSSTSVYGDHSAQWIDENAELRPTSPQGKMRRDSELATLSTEGIEGYTLRVVGIYGPGRTILGRLESGRYPLVDGGKKITNRIHVEDLAQAALATALRAPAGSRAYNVSDGQPTAVRDLVSFVCEHTGLPMPEEVSIEDYARRVQNPDIVARWTNSARVSNRRLIEELQLELRYPDVFAGYRPLLAKHTSS
ncbi:NAD-dependent epimerase/dehydratase family protein [Lujinxingia vulgaris]|uniref:NAD-dependent epimerase/dehydratase family protein n=1 Tax=Lujinxingia vulgaris TaxID=2600176 RepID=A0A5C6XD67_9DELT|nr:NAD-dependent epimerase/dehydratase family protein [Lujinxingia vulgaris]TXD37221.1 NAD-dependent epimerase/dehydratase family protein [Lujinxingia vulgaris]